MENRIIKPLPETDFRILKQISIITENQFGIDICIGNLLYKRKFNPDYQFNNIEKADKKYQFYIDYPTQEMYPNDDADDLILQSVRTTFPKSIVKNHSIIFNLDIEKIETFKNGTLLNKNIILSPEFPYFTNPSDFSHMEFKVKNLPINIYSNHSTFFVTGQNLFGKYESNDLTILDKFTEIEFI